MNISKKILSDPVCSWIFLNANKDVYLVGGYIRDLLLGQKSGDRDFIIRGKAEDVARRVSIKFNGTFIELQKRKTFRVALKDRRFLDFTSLSGSIENDLHLRDFTVNAIAWSPETGLVAPPHHMVDIKNRALKVVRPDNLKDDPLRILRAYRLSAQLEFYISTVTRVSLKRYASGLIKTASERVTEELYKMLNIDNSAICLHSSQRDKVISQLIPLTNRIIVKNIESINEFESLLNKIKSSQRNSELLKYLNSGFSQGLTRAGLIKLHFLIRPLKTSQYTLKFRLLCMSNKIRKGLQAFSYIDSICRLKLNLNLLFDIYSRSADLTYEMALVLALNKNRDYRIYLEKARDFLFICNKPLLKGNEIMDILNFDSGEIIGRIITSIQMMRYRGRIKNKRQARLWVMSNFT